MYISMHVPKCVLSELSLTTRLMLMCVTSCMTLYRKSTIDSKRNSHGMTCGKVEPKSFSDTTAALDGAKTQTHLVTWMLWSVLTASWPPHPNTQLEWLEWLRIFFVFLLLYKMPLLLNYYTIFCYLIWYIIVLYCHIRIILSTYSCMNFLEKNKL